MLKFPNGGCLVADESELPWPEEIDTLYLDFETTSGDPDEDSTNVWQTCSMLGVCVTWDKNPQAYYVPVRHHPDFLCGFQNLPIDVARRWLAHLFSRCRRWVNHNVKYDVHVAWHDGVDVLEFVKRGMQTVCTLTLSKIIDSDRMMKGGYGLDALAKDWCGIDIDRYHESLQAYLPRKGSARNKDYARIALDVLAEYGCHDVLSNRPLWRYIDGRCPEQCRFVWDTEIRLTPKLAKWERRGLRVDPTQLAYEEFKIINDLVFLEKEIQDATGMYLRPHINDDCYDYFVNTLGLPVLGFTKDGNPSFDKDTLKKYLAMPEAPRDIVKKMISYREMNTLNSFFVQPYQELQVDGFLHTWFNQAVRTGRMSASVPNVQQLSKRAKQLVHPREGHSFISNDYSQIEFRLIAHYIEDERAITAYNADPYTDFHTWVAELCGIPRKPAKTTNFLMGYGGGKDKLLEQLSAEDTIVKATQETIDQAIAEGRLAPEFALQAFKRLCRDRAEHVYVTYHRMLPSLKRTSAEAARAAKRRGYVHNAYGRHRHLPPSHAHIAFNTVNQSTAADLIKERTVEIDDLLEQAGVPVYIVAQVHDEELFEGETAFLKSEDGKRVLNDIVWLMEHPQVDLKIPVRTSCGVSEKTWAEAGSDDASFVVRATPPTVLVPR